MGSLFVGLSPETLGPAIAAVCAAAQWSRSRWRLLEIGSCRPVPSSRSAGR
jgi:hypothetical protein